MADGDVAVAGLPSLRLSQLASPQLFNRRRGQGSFKAEHTAMGKISEALYPDTPEDQDSSPVWASCPSSPEEFAGKPSSKTNESIFSTTCRKHYPVFNDSKQVADLFSSAEENPVMPENGTRSLKKYFSPDELAEAFCSKFHVTDPHTGRTELMMARRPGKASAETKAFGFGLELLPRERPSAIRRAKDNIEQNAFVRSSNKMTVLETKHPVLLCRIIGGRVNISMFYSTSIIY